MVLSARYQYYECNPRFYLQTSTLWLYHFYIKYNYQVILRVLLRIREAPPQVILFPCELYSAFQQPRSMQIRRPKEACSTTWLYKPIKAQEPPTALNAKNQFPGVMGQVVGNAGDNSRHRKMRLLEGGNFLIRMTEPCVPEDFTCRVHAPRPMGLVCICGVRGKCGPGDEYTRVAGQICRSEAGSSTMVNG